MGSEALSTDIGIQAGSSEPDVDSARLGFGCAGLMRLPSRRQRQALLGEAFEHGLAHFDLARMYGLGLAEAEVGRFARGRRDRMTIATKFGIEPPNPSLARLQAPARAAIAQMPGLRAALKRVGGDPGAPRHYRAAAARRSLETSLRELGTDHVDYFFVHDPAPGDLVDIDELGELFEELRARGIARACGISGDPNPCVELARASGGVLQVRDEVFAPLPRVPQEGEPTISFGVLARPMTKILDFLSASPRRRERWQSRLGLDCTRPEILSALLLQDALARNRRGTVLFATSRRERIGPAAAASSPPRRQLDESTLRRFRECLVEDLEAPVRIVA
jgi:hypothetical protein